MDVIVAMLAACERADANACMEEGRRLRDGIGVDADPNRAAIAFQRACDLGLAAACAQIVDPGAAGVVMFSLRRTSAMDPAAYGGVPSALVVGLHATQFATARPKIGLGIDLDVGRAHGGGFVYDARVLLGSGGWLGHSAAIGLFAGLAVDGIVNHVPFALKAPLEVQAVVPITPVFTLHGTGGVDFAFATDAVRTGGAPIGDAVRIGADAFIGRRTLSAVGEDYRTDLVLGGALVATMDTRLFVFTVGLGSAEQVLRQGEPRRRP